MTTSDARKRNEERRALEDDCIPTALGRPCDECRSRRAVDDVDLLRDVESLTVDGLQLPPNRIMRDGFKVDTDQGRLTMTLVCDDLQVTYKADEPAPRPLPTEAGTVIRASLSDYPDTPPMLLELDAEGNWRRHLWACRPEAIAPGWVRLVEETQP